MRAPLSATAAIAVKCHNSSASNAKSLCFCLSFRFVEVNMDAGMVVWPLFNSLQAFWPGLQVCQCFLALPVGVLVPSGLPCRCAVSLWPVVVLLREQRSARNLGALSWSQHERPSVSMIASRVLATMQALCSLQSEQGSA